MEPNWPPIIPEVAVSMDDRSALLLLIWGVRVNPVMNRSQITDGEATHVLLSKTIHTSCLSWAYKNNSAQKLVYCPQLWENVAQMELLGEEVTAMDTEPYSQGSRSGLPQYPLI